MKGDENMRKFAICHYSNFMVDSIGVALTSEQTFLVTPEFEEHKAFKSGLELGMIEFIDVTSWVQIKGAVGVTGEILEEIKALFEVPEIEAEPEPVPDVVEPISEPKPGSESEESTVEDSSEGVGDEPAKPQPDIDGMKYKDLQTYALELEKQFGVDINRRAATKVLRASVKKILEKHND